MKRGGVRLTIQTTLFVSGIVASLAGETWAEEGGHGTHRPTAGKPPVKTTMEQLHRLGGVPRGWRFTLPEGDPVAGRHVFITMECYSCHRVQGEDFPAQKPDSGKVGPDLTGMGAHHPREYLAEAILNPNAVILTDDPRWVGPDGLSIMPSYGDTMILRQLTDLVAYLKSLTGSAPAGPASAEHPKEGGGHRH